MLSADGVTGEAEAEKVADFWGGLVSVETLEGGGEENEDVIVGDDREGGERKEVFADESAFFGSTFFLFGLASFEPPGFTDIFLFFGIGLDLSNLALMLS